MVERRKLDLAQAQNPLVSWTLLARFRELPPLEATRVEVSRSSTPGDPRSTRLHLFKPILEESQWEMGVTYKATCCWGSVLVNYKKITFT